MHNQFNTSLWGDEGFSAILSMKSLPEIIKIIINDTSPPLWNISEWLVFNTLGTDEIYIRGLAFFYFLITVFFVYKIGSLLWDKKTAVLSATLTFLNPFFFIYAFEGRMYSVLTAGVTASFYFFLRILKTKDQKLRTFDKAGYVVATLWAMYSHHFAIFAVFLQGLWFIKEMVNGKWKMVNQLFRLFVIIGIGYLPWVYPLYNQTKMVGGGFWLGTPTLKELRNLIYEYLAEGIKSHPFEIFSLRLHQIALYFVLAGLLFKKWFKDFKHNLFLTSWFLFPILATWGVSQVFQSIFFNRYLLYTIPAAMLLVASQRRKILSSLVLAVTIVLFVIIDFHYFTQPTKRPFRELAAYVKETRQEGDFLINWNAASHHLWETKYYEIPAPIYIPGEAVLPFFVGTALMEEGDVINTLPDVPRVGVVTSGSIEEIDLPGYTEIEAKTFRAEAEGSAEIHFVWYEQK